MKQSSCSSYSNQEPRCLTYKKRSSMPPTASEKPINVESHLFVCSKTCIALDFSASSDSIALCVFHLLPIITNDCWRVELQSSEFRTQSNVTNGASCSSDARHSRSAYGYGMCDLFTKCHSRSFVISTRVRLSVPSSSSEKNSLSKAFLLVSRKRRRAHIDQKFAQQTRAQ